MLYSHGKMHPCIIGIPSLLLVLFISDLDCLSPNATLPSSQAHDGLGCRDEERIHQDYTFAAEVLSAKNKQCNSAFDADTAGSYAVRKTGLTLRHVVTGHLQVEQQLRQQHASRSA